MYERLERELTNVERQSVEAAVNLEVPDNPLLAMPGVRDKLINNLKLRQKVNQAILDDGYVVVHRCKAYAVVRLLQTEDEGDSYFFDVGNGQILCYCYYDAYMVTGVIKHEDWPNNHFEFVHTRVNPSTHFEWLTCHGERMTPVRDIKGSMELWQELPKSTVHLLSGSLNSIENDLKQCRTK